MDINTKVLFVHMLLKANWKEGKFRDITVPRGSFVSSYQHLAEECNMTVNEIRTALKHLVSTGEVTVKTTNKYSIFTINNYCKYQDINSLDDSQGTGDTHPINRQLTIIEPNNKGTKKQDLGNIVNDISCPEPEKSAPNLSGIKLILNDKTYYDAPLDKIAVWKEVYPAVDVMQELQKMRAWLDSNPTRRKTRRGIERFINNWLSRSQDNGSRLAARGGDTYNASKEDGRSFAL